MLGQNPDIEVSLFLYKVRKYSITNYYRPHFRLNEMLTSGSITLVDKKELSPGESGEARVEFIAKEPGCIRVGDILLFSEGIRVVGEAKVTKIISSSMEKTE